MAPSYFARKNARLLAVPSRSVWSAKRYKFRQYSGIKKSRRCYFRGFEKLYFWRAQKVETPPQFLVHQHGGASSDYQLPPKPHYFRGVSHMLFPGVPHERSGFHGLRKTKSGKLVGSNLHPKIREIAKPRL